MTFERWVSELTEEQQAWLAEQDFSSTGGDVRDYLIAMSIAGRWFAAFPRARRFNVPSPLYEGFARVAQKNPQVTDTIDAGTTTV